MTPGLSRDELQRQLRETEQLQREASRPFRDALLRTVGRRSGRRRVSASGLALDRRGFLVAGGGSVLAAAVLAACGTDEEPSLPVSGQPTTTNTFTGQEVEVSDEALLRTAQSYEILAVEVYDDLFASGLLDGERELEQTLELFRDQHEEHGEFFGEAVVELGGRQAREANQVALQEVVTPALETVTDVDTAAAFAHTLETIVAQTYEAFVEVMLEPVNRQAVMSVGGVEARHAALVASFVPDVEPVPGAFQQISMSMGERTYI